MGSEAEPSLRARTMRAPYPEVHRRDMAQIDPALEGRQLAVRDFLPFHRVVTHLGHIALSQFQHLRVLQQGHLYVGALIHNCRDLDLGRVRDPTL
eukprot:5365364-Amphidinium_carterae.4